MNLNFSADGIITVMSRQFKSHSAQRFSIFVLLLMSVLLIPFDPSQLAGAANPTLSSWGTATVDGVIWPGEYGSCLTNSLPNVGYAFRFCETNDAVNLYVAFEIADLTNNTQDSLNIYFDNNHSGVVLPCISGTSDQAFVMNGIAPGVFVDSNYCHSGSTSTPQANLMQYGLGVRKMNGPGSVYEISHPLCSHNQQNFCLHYGDAVGWCLAYYDQAVNNGGTFPNNCQGPMYFNGDASGFGNILISSPPSSPVTTTITTNTLQLPYTSTMTLTSSGTTTTTSYGLNVVHATTVLTMTYVQEVTSTARGTVTSITNSCQTTLSCTVLTVVTVLISTVAGEHTESVTSTATVLSPQSITETRTLMTVNTTTESATGSYTITVMTTYVSTYTTTTMSANNSTSTTTATTSP